MQSYEHSHQNSTNNQNSNTNTMDNKQTISGSTTFADYKCGEQLKQNLRKLEDTKTLEQAAHNLVMLLTVTSAIIGASNASLLLADLMFYAAKCQRLLEQNNIELP